MIQAVGYNTREVYATGETKAEVMRFLQKEYPTFTSKKHVRQAGIFPEPLILCE